jgi:hypothetical protein
MNKEHSHENSNSWPGLKKTTRTKTTLCFTRMMKTYEYKVHALHICWCGNRYIEIRAAVRYHQYWLCTLIINNGTQKDSLFISCLQWKRWLRKLFLQNFSSASLQVKWRNGRGLNSARLTQERHEKSVGDAQRLAEVPAHANGGCHCQRVAQHAHRKVGAHQIEQYHV